MKCPWQTITTETYEGGGNGTDRVKVSQTVFIDCIGDECPFYERNYYLRYHTDGHETVREREPSCGRVPKRGAVGGREG